MSDAITQRPLKTPCPACKKTLVLRLYAGVATDLRCTSVHNYTIVENAPSASCTVFVLSSHGWVGRPALPEMPEAIMREVKAINRRFQKGTQQ